MSTPKELPHEKEAWNGYTLDELRYMRAYTAARLEINRDRLRRNFGNVKKLGFNIERSIYHSKTVQ